GGTEQEAAGEGHRPARDSPKRDEGRGCAVVRVVIQLYHQYDTVAIARSRVARPHDRPASSGPGPGCAPVVRPDGPLHRGHGDARAAPPVVGTAARGGAGGMSLVRRARPPSVAEGL